MSSSPRVWSPGEILPGWAQAGSQSQDMPGVREMWSQMQSKWEDGNDDVDFVCAFEMTWVGMIVINMQCAIDALLLKQSEDNVQCLYQSFAE